MHDASKRIEDGVFMVDSYIVGVDNGPDVPEIFSRLNLRRGTWIASYRIDNDNVWAKVKAGEFKGFSVEGYFGSTQIEIKKKFRAVKGYYGNVKDVNVWNIEVNEDSFNEGESLTITRDDITTPLSDGEYMLEDGQRILVDSDGVIRQVFNKNKKMNKKKSWFQKLFDTEHQFMEITAADNTVLSYDGELAEGTEIFVMADGDRLPAPEGDYQVELNGVNSIIAVDSNGVVSSVTEVVEQEQMSAEFKQFMTDYDNSQKEKFKALEDIVAQQAVILENMQSAMKSKFNYTPMSTNDVEKTSHWSQYLKLGK